MFFLMANVPTSAMEIKKPLIEFNLSVTTLRNSSWGFNEIRDFDKTVDLTEFFNKIGTTLNGNDNYKVQTSYNSNIDEITENYDIVVKNHNIKRLILNVNLKITSNIKHKVVL